MYANWTGSSWDKLTADSSGDFGWFNSIALDSSGNPHISYLNTANNYLMYATTTLPRDFFVVPANPLGLLLTFVASLVAFMVFARVRYGKRVRILQGLFCRLVLF